MFWHKRTTHKFPLVVFGLVALGIIIFSIIILFRLFQEKEVYEAKKSNVVSGESMSLEENYFNSIKNLLSLVEQENTVGGVVDSTKQVFLSVRVPAGLRDNHLASFLEIVKLEDQRNTLTLDQMKTEIKNILQSIIILENK